MDISRILPPARVLLRAHWNGMTGRMCGLDIIMQRAEGQWYNVHAAIALVFPSAVLGGPGWVRAYLLGTRVAGRRLVHACHRRSTLHRDLGLLTLLYMIPTISISNAQSKAVSWVSGPVRIRDPAISGPRRQGALASWAQAKALFSEVAPLANLYPSPGPGILFYQSARNALYCRVWCCLAQEIYGVLTWLCN